MSTKNGIHLDNIFKAVRKAGYELSTPKNKYQFLNAKDFGVLQDRKRVIIIGWKTELGLTYPEFENNESNNEVLKDLFSDLRNW